MSFETNVEWLGGMVRLGQSMPPHPVQLANVHQKLVQCCFAIILDERFGSSRTMESNHALKHVDQMLQVFGFLAEERMGLMKNKRGTTKTSLVFVC